jgi:hypothetical protein
MPDRSDVFTQLPDDQLGRLSLIEAVRAQTDQVARLARAEESRDGKLEAIKEQLGDMKTSIALLQRESPRAELTALALRVAALEAINERNRGERGAIAAVFNSKALAWVFAGALGLVAWFRGAFH